jgi:uncharacterized coiled-coil protein SlyX
VLLTRTAIDYITSLETQVKQQRLDSDKQRHQMQEMEHKLQQLADQLKRQQHPGAASYPVPPTAMPQSPLNYSQYHANGIDGAASAEQARTLPPLVNGAMQGVQYGEERR